MRGVVRVLVRPTLGPRLPVRVQRAILSVMGRITALPDHCTVTSVDLGGRPADRIETPGADAHRAVLYLHGGGYTVGGLATHLALAAHLAESAGAPVYLLDYRLAPEHPYPAALDDAHAAYRALRESGVAAHAIAITGDSAGGGLALATIGRIRRAADQLPGALALVSPWVDVTLSEVEDHRRDPMLTTAWLRACAERYCAGADPATPEISPLFADLAGLPPTFVQAASDEILVDDVERFVDRARAAGASVDYRRLEGMWHVEHLHAGLVTAATDAVADIGEFVRKQTIPS